MALPAAFLDELRARTPISALIGRKTRLTRSGRQWKGCCPFHGEKTPSFYVYDDHFHCFGCGAHGDAISFVMQSQGASFPEAVEQLAVEAGLDVPKPTAAVAAAERRRHDLHSVLEAAEASFQRRLFRPEGRRALAYLGERGLSEATIRDFGLGWSGEGRDALATELAAEEIGRDLLLEAGLLRAADDTGRLVDQFFNRVMFPIRDRRGRVVSFGGRTLGDGQPKYVNGPETAVFSKRRSLYGLDRARTAVRDGAAVVVVEGYMDVIALQQAGFGGAVAPLGTALTQEQLEELWRLTPVPVLCFDGDAAGRRAARRAADLALPSLTPERTLRILPLPEGQDPDLLVSKHGAADFRSRLDAARSLSDAWFDLLHDDTRPKTPEQRAAFRDQLRAAAARIADKSLAAEYRSAWFAKYADSRARPDIRRRRAGTPTNPLTLAEKGIPRQPPSDRGVAPERARILTAILIRHPGLMHDVSHAYAELQLPPPLDRVRNQVLRWAETADALDSQALIAHLTHSGLESETARVVAATPVPLPRCASPEAMPAEAEAGWWHIFGLMHRERLEEEVAAARRQFEQRADVPAQRRLIALCTAFDALCRGEERGDVEA